MLQNYDSISDIPVEKLRTVGWVSIGISVSDIRNLTFDDSDIIQAFGIYHALNAEQVIFYEISILFLNLQL